MASSVVMWILYVSSDAPASAFSVNKQEKVIQAITHVHPGKPCDLFNQLAKKFVTHAAALLVRSPGIRRLQQNRLLLGSTRGQSRIPEVAFSSSSGRHW